MPCTAEVLPSIKELALAKVSANQAYVGLLYASTAGLSDEDLATREIGIARARKALFAADRALAEAV